MRTATHEDYPLPTEEPQSPVVPVVVSEQAPEPYTLRTIQDIEACPIFWLWPGVLALGKVVMLSGDPGLGKSQLTCSLSAITTKICGKFPLSEVPTPSGDVLLITGEDDPGDTIRPRLEAAGADLSRVHILEAVRDGSKRRSFTLDKDMGVLVSILSSNEDIQLLIIDPITAYLGEANGHNNAEIRALLTPLQEIASRYDVAVICVSHLNKGGGKATINRFTGSLAFVAAARAAYLVTRDANDPERRLFLPVKNNIGDDKRGYSFTIESVSLPGGIDTSRVVWGNDYVTESADDIMSQHEDREASGAVKEAMGFLRTLLDEGPMLSKQIQVEAKDAGHSWATVKRAMTALQIEPYKQTGLKGKWVWELPGRCSDEVPYE